MSIVNPLRKLCSANAWSMELLVSPGALFWLTVEERGSWIATMEAEERDRLDSLRARISEFEAGETTTPHQVNALLISALQAQITLMRMSRVFPDHSFGKLTDVTSALAHSPTAALACELYYCWKVLGVAAATLKSLLFEVLLRLGKQTRKARWKLFVDVKPNFRRGVDAKALISFIEEGSGPYLALWDTVTPCRHSCISCASRRGILVFRTLSGSSFLSSTLYRLAPDAP